MNAPLPAPLARRWGYLRFIKQVGVHEWHSECPECGDYEHVGNKWPDRFFMRDDGSPRGFCRRCGYQDFADSDKKEFRVTPEMRQAWMAERVVREEEERCRAEHAIELLRRENAWLQWHTNMMQAGYEFWTSKGVMEWAINYFQLGYCPSRTFWSNGNEFTCSTATIPVFSVGWNLVNLRHRLINAPDPDDRYRPDRTGLPSSLYLTDPDNTPSGECILVEGEIKAIVLREYIDNGHISIVGIPGKRPRKELLGQLADCSKVYVTLDPDATPQAVDIAKTLGAKRARVVSLPDKPDDCFVQFGMTENSFMTALKQASVAI